MSVDPIRQQELFEAALERPPDERDAFLDGACAGDQELRARVSALLASLAAADDFLAEPEQAPAGAGEQPGGVIDRYKLLQQIGEGGFGTVWMAEQLEPVRRKVALKVIKLGMDTRQVVARFEAERQALALMEHPNIAKVFDGGITPGGRPYFVMELIKGEPITEYCDLAELGTPERLELFQQVCHAVQHAHQKGVIHRDLKPSNILVTLHDGVPVPKVIDFGIAKATSAELTQKTLFTEFRQMVGTPEYMAPEQAELSGLDVDTRADVYSLGVVLYEMLTGTKPFDMSVLLEQGYLEMLRVIREDVPPKPSTRISTLGDQLAVVAQRRHATPGSLSRLVYGDLDWIVMKALEKERSRRYVTANDFAADIGRHLQDEPVHACPPSAVYRLRKYVRRHRLGVSAGAGVLLALVAGLAVASWGWWETDAQRVRAVKAEGDANVERDAAKAARLLAEDEKLLADAQRARAEKAEGDAIVERNAAQAARELAEGERQKAETEAERAHMVIALVEEMLGSADPRQGKGLDYTVRQLLDDFDRGLGDKLASQPEVEASLRAIMASAYLGLGSYDEAASHAEASLAIRQREFGAAHPAIAESLLMMAQVLGRQGRLRQAEAMFREALAICREFFGVESRQVGSCLSGLSQVLLRMGKLAEAEEMSREALEISRKVRGADHPIVAVNLTTLGDILLQRGKLAEAEAVMRESLDMNRRLLGDEHPEIAGSLHSLAWLLTSLGKPAEAEPLAREALAMNRKLLGNEHPQVAVNLSNLGGCLASQSKFEAAESNYREALDMQRKFHGEEHTSVAVALSNLGQVLMVKYQLEEAETMQRKALAMRKKFLGDEHPSVAIGLDNLGKVLIVQGKLEEAERMLREALEMRRRLFPHHPHPQILLGLSNLARALQALERLDEAETLLREALALSHELFGAEHSSVARVLGYLGTVLLEQGELEKAEAMLRQSLPLSLEFFGAQHLVVARVRGSLGEVQRQQGDLEEAETMQIQSLATRRQIWSADHPDIAEGLRNLALVLSDQGKLAEAESMLRESLAIYQEFFDDEHPTVVKALGHLSTVLEKQE